MKIPNKTVGTWTQQAHVNELPADSSTDAINNLLDFMRADRWMLMGPPVEQATRLLFFFSRLEAHQG